VLSDREREALREIQCRLLAEDPAFARVFSTDARRLERMPSHLPRSTYTTLAMTSMTLGVIALMAGAPLIGLVFAVTAAVMWGLRLRAGRAGHRRTE
jgi:hypothetical protein